VELLASSRREELFFGAVIASPLQLCGPVQSEMFLSYQQIFALLSKGDLTRAEEERIPLLIHLSTKLMGTCGDVHYSHANHEENIAGESFWPWTFQVLSVPHEYLDNYQLIAITK
jgi:hypothetical protein